MRQIKCKIKKVSNFKESETWFLPPTNISEIKSTIEAALKNAQYAVNPSEYYETMAVRLSYITQLEKDYPNCICGIKVSGNICYILPDEKPAITN